MNYIQTLVFKLFCYVIHSLISKLLAVLYLSADVCINTVRKIKRGYTKPSF